MKSKSIIQSISWISQVSKRFSRVDRSSRSVVTSILAVLGICFGVMTLIVVMSVMNGFQMSFIDSILEISSYHNRVVDLPENCEDAFIDFCAKDKQIMVVSPFYEAQALTSGKKGGTNAVLVRAIDENAYWNDYGFYSEVKIINGSFDLSNNDSIVLGSSLARQLGVQTGDTVNFLAMSGGSDVDLFSDNRRFTVTGIFTSGYQEINSSYAFVNIAAAETYFGKDCKKIWGIKLHNYNNDMHSVSKIKKYFSENNIEAQVLSWRDYNKTFFGTLKIEKNMLFLLMALIFVVVAINIYNGMRRLVFERKNEIAILSTLGARNWEIKSIFIYRGFVTGMVGAITGLILGVLISFNTDVIFNLAAKVMYFFQYLFTAITNSENLIYVRENSTYSVYASVPARIFPSEVAAITIFGILAPLFSSWAASKNVLKMNVSEILHNE